jgi:hypothetical protein
LQRAGELLDGDFGLGHFRGVGVGLLIAVADQK